MPITALALLLAQAGPLVTGGAAPPIQPVPLPRPRTSAAPAEAVPEPTRLQLCLAAIDEDPLAAIAAAEEWLKVSKGTTTAEPNHCLGVAYNRLSRPVEAEVAFTFARDAVPANELRRRASYGAMAALAMFEQDDPARADAAFAQAQSDAQTAGDARLAADIAIDHSRAQIALQQESAAGAGLAAGRAGSPENPAGWLLSATLARRQGQLVEAQRYIERAADLAPYDPQVGLEAGVIAVLAGRDEAARRSWLAVLKMAPDSVLAKTAQGYIDQLGPAPAAAPAAATEGR